MTLDVEAYLAHLGVSHPGGPSVANLFALHRAQVSRVPYETLEIQLGRPSTVDPHESIARILTGRGGYCYHLNGALSEVLAALGYDVRRHVGGVFSAGRPSQGANGNHLALTVRVDGTEWFVDAGLGDALFEPMPLREGTVTQGPLTFTLGRSPVVDGGWRFMHDPAADSFEGMDFAPEPVGMDAFAAMHQELSTSPDSGFVKVPQVGHRTAAGVDFISGCVLRTIDASGLTRRTLSSVDQWFAAAETIVGRPLWEFDDAARTRLWSWLWPSHERWAATLTAPLA